MPRPDFMGGLLVKPPKKKKARTISYDTPRPRVPKTVHPKAGVLRRERTIERKKESLRKDLPILSPEQLAVVAPKYDFGAYVTREAKKRGLTIEQLAATTELGMSREWLLKHYPKLRKMPQQGVRAFLEQAPSETARRLVEQEVAKQRKGALAATLSPQAAALPELVKLANWEQHGASLGLGGGGRLIDPKAPPYTPGEQKLLAAEIDALVARTKDADPSDPQVAKDITRIKDMQTTLMMGIAGPNEGWRKWLATQITSPVNIMLGIPSGIHALATHPEDALSAMWEGTVHTVTHPWEDVLATGLTAWGAAGLAGLGVQAAKTGAKLGGIARSGEGFGKGVFEAAYGRAAPAQVSKLKTARALTQLGFRGPQAPRRTIEIDGQTLELGPYSQAGATRILQAAKDWAAKRPEAKSDLPWPGVTSVAQARARQSAIALAERRANFGRDVDLEVENQRAKTVIDKLQADDARTMNALNLAIAHPEQRMMVYNGLLRQGHSPSNINAAFSFLEREVSERAAKERGSAKKSIGTSAITVPLDTLNDAARLSLLYFNPAYIKNLPFNLIFNISERGIFAAKDLVKAMATLRSFDRALNRNINTGMRVKYSVSGSLPQEGSLLRPVTRTMGDAWSQITDLVPRRAAFFGSAARRGFHSQDEIRDLMENPKWEQIRNDVLREANESMVDYTRAGTTEMDRFLRHMIIFYPWMKGSALWGGRFAREHPVQTGLAAQIGPMGIEMAEQDIGPSPSYNLGIFQTGWDKELGLPRIGNPAAGNPLGTVADIAGFVGNITGIRPSRAYEPTEFLTPALDALVAAGFRFDPFTKVAADEYKTFGDLLLEQLVGQKGSAIPVFRWYQRFFGEKDKRDPSELLYPIPESSRGWSTQSIAELMFGPSAGVFVPQGGRVYNPKKGTALAAEEAVGSRREYAFLQAEQKAKEIVEKMRDVPGFPVSDFATKDGKLKPMFATALQRRTELNERLREADVLEDLPGNPKKRVLLTAQYAQELGVLKDWRVYEEMSFADYENVIEDLHKRIYGPLLVMEREINKAWKIRHGKELFEGSE
jgi:hypothetical protein